MRFIEHPLIKPETIEQREYQTNILKTSSKKNTLCVLPTGTGKTNIAILLAAQRLEEFPDSKILIVAPTRPLCAQHQKSFQDFLNIPEEDIILVTGKISPAARGRLYRSASIICATPQCIRNDLQAEILDLSKFSLLVVDECLTEEAKVLLANGMLKPIKEVVKDVLNGNDVFVASFDSDKNNFTVKKVTNAQKIPCLKRIIKIKTEDGKEIRSTEDHKFFVKGNNKIEWVEAKKLAVDNKLAFFPKFLDIESTKKEILVEENDILKTYSEKGQKNIEIYKNALGLQREFKRGQRKISKKLDYSERQIENWIYRDIKPNALQTIERMKEMGLLPLTTSNPAIKIIARIFGHLFGDGWVYIEKNRSVISLGFSGKVEDLKKIQKDLELIGIKHSNIHSRKTKSKVKGREVKGITNYFTCSDSILSRLVCALGAPKGKKTIQKVELPKWIMKGSKSIKREFLAALFGSEGSSPTQIKDSRSIYSIRISVNKRKDLEKNGLKYFNQIKKLLADFDVQVSQIKVMDGNVWKDGTETIKILLTLSNSRKNLINFLKNISFEYSSEKEKKAVRILNYLLEKENLNVKRKKAYEAAIKLKEGGHETRTIVDITDMPNFQVARWTKKIVKPERTPYYFPTFDMWSKNNKATLLWKKIISISIDKQEEFVYDLTVKDTHNFIANGFVVHNCHRSVRKYAYPAVAGVYNKIAKNPRILGLTASPGSSQEKINEICKNLFIKSVEIRSEEDADVRPYIKELDIEFVKVELPEEFKKIRESFKAILKERTEKLKKYNINFRTKRELIQAQKLISRKLALERNPVYFHIAALLAETLKLWYLLELLETQSIESVRLYLEKLSKSQARSAKRILANEQIKNSILALEQLHSSGKEHPKIHKLKQIVSKELEKNKDVKIIIFSHYRNNINLIKKILEPIKNCRPAILIGQAGEAGLSQKEQIDIIRDYEVDIYNILITSPVGEEGLNLVGSDIAVFYEPIPSEIRTLQRKGRVARFKVGKVIFLITKNTRDEGYFWVAKRKERTMKKILRGMQNSKKLEEFI